MPSNQEYKGKGTKGRNYDELSGVGTSSAGITGTTGNLNDAGHDGGVGTPDPNDTGNLQHRSSQPGGTPALGDSPRQQGNRQGSAGGSRQSSGDADQLRGTDGDRQRARRQESRDQPGSAPATDQD